MKSEIVSITKPIQADLLELTPEQFIVYQARVSSPNNQHNHDTGEKLLRYCLENGHWSVFDMVDVTFEIHTSRAIMAQILRHSSFKFQEFCVAGSTMITFESPGAIEKGKRGAFKRPISKLYEMQEAKKPIPSRVRVFDEKNKIFTTASVKKVFQTGVKQTFRVTLENGRHIECTKEHKFLTENGFISLEDAVGLTIKGSVVCMAKSDTFLACNGEIAYRNKDWMLQAKLNSISEKTGLKGIAEAANVSYHTIRKWLKILGLQYTKLEVANYCDAWNKGLKGYRLGPHSEATIEKMKKSARKGPESNLWRGGSCRRERLKIADWCNSNRTKFLRDSNYKCVKCGGSKKLELHHIKTVADRPDLAYELSNIEVLCSECHREHHNTNGDRKIWRSRSRGNALTTRWSKVRHIELVGDQMTYDLEVDHESHNYVGNGIVVHNSQRYSEVKDFDFSDLEIRLKHEGGNRQGSGEPNPEMTHAAMQVLRNNALMYSFLVEDNAAPESARMVLPLCTPTRAYMKGSVRSWITYFWQRRSAHAQKASSPSSQSTSHCARQSRMLDR